MKIYKNFILMVTCFVLITGSRPAHGQLFFMENPLIGERAPDFTLDTINGSKMNMTDYRDGQSAIAFFWATWCPHCRTQLRGLNKQRREFDKKNIKIILIDVGENGKQVKSYIDKNKIGFNVFLDADSNLSEQYEIIGVPTFFFINKAGVIQAVEHSLPDNYEEILQGG